MMPEFDRQWKAMGLGDDDLQRLQVELLIDSRHAVVIPKTGGLRKMRFALPNRGKSGSVRVAYVDFAEYGIIYLITAYPKNKKDTLSDRECKEIKRLIELLEQTIRRRRGNN